MASINMNGIYKCGGSLVASKYVISAAHCMFTIPKNMLVRILPEQMKVSLSNKVEGQFLY